MHIARPVQGHARAPTGIVGGGPAAYLAGRRWRRQSSRARRRQRSRSSATAPATRARRLESMNLASVWKLPADLRRREQRVRRDHIQHLVGGQRQHRRPRGRIRHAGCHRRRLRLLRRARGGRARRSTAPGQAAVRPPRDRSSPATSATSRATSRPIGTARSSMRGADWTAWSGSSAGDRRPAAHPGTSTPSMPRSRPMDRQGRRRGGRRRPPAEARPLHRRLRPATD